MICWVIVLLKYASFNNFGKQEISDKNEIIKKAI